MRELSAPSAMLFFDEATSFRCVASADECEAACEADRRLKSDLWGGATLSYCDAAKLRLLSMERCAWPPGGARNVGWNGVNCVLGPAARELASAGR